MTREQPLLVDLALRIGGVLVLATLLVLFLAWLFAEVHK